MRPRRAPPRQGAARCESSWRWTWSRPAGRSSLDVRDGEAHVVAPGRGVGMARALRGPPRRRLRGCSARARELPSLRRGRSRRARGPGDAASVRGRRKPQRRSAPRGIGGLERGHDHVKHRAPARRGPDREPRLGRGRRVGRGRRHVDRHGRRRVRLRPRRRLEQRRLLREPRERPPAATRDRDGRGARGASASKRLQSTARVTADVTSSALDALPAWGSRVRIPSRAPAFASRGRGLGRFVAWGVSPGAAGAPRGG